MNHALSRVVPLGLGIVLLTCCSLAHAQISVDVSGGTAFNPGVRGQNPYRNLTTAGWNNLWDLTEGTSSRGVAGGLDADSYDWRDLDSGAPWGARNNTWSTLEFLRETRDRGSWPQFTANVVGGGSVATGGPWGDYYIYDTSTPVSVPAQLAADWVRYTNRILQNYRQGETITDTEDQRVYDSITGWEGRDKLLAPGEASTPRVEYWEVGNEPEVSVGGVFEQHTMSAATYSERYRAVSEAMLAQDPTIKVGPCIVYPNGSSHYLTQLVSDGAQIDFLSYHPYYGDLQNAWGSASGLTNALRNFKGYLNGHAADARTILGSNTELLATEWNPMMWNASSTQQRSMAMALGVVEGVFTFIQDDITAAHFWEQAQGKPAVDAMYDALRDHLGGKLVAETADFGGDTATDNWRLYVTRDEETFQTVLWGLNFDENSNIQKSLELLNLPWDIENVTLMRYGTAGTGDTGLMTASGLGWDTEDITATFDPSNFAFDMYDAELTMVVIQHVPEPASIVLLGAGGLALLRRHRRRV